MLQASLTFQYWCLSKVGVPVGLLRASGLALPVMMLAPNVAENHNDTQRRLNPVADRH